MWLSASACVVAVLGLFGSAAFAFDQARSGLHVLKEGAGPQAMATTELYLSLADMDAHMADVLLMGTDHDLGSRREDALKRYDTSRTKANETLVQAALLTEDDEVEKRNVQLVLDGMGAYERLVTRARLLNDEANAPSGRVDQEALEEYRRATRLMHTELLPKAFNLGLDSSAIVRADHEERQSAAGFGLVGVGVTGLMAVTALLALQMYLRVRFRRRMNVPLLGATAGTVLLTAGMALALFCSSGHQREAKEGLDAVMALSRAGAISTDMQADESRYLIDPDRADNYQQVYLERAQQVLFCQANELATYYEAIEKVAKDQKCPDPDEPDKNSDALGYLGPDAQKVLLSGSEGALAEVLESYAALQSQDRALRAAKEDGDLSEAIDIRMGITDAEDGAFQAYEGTLAELIQQRRDAFDEGNERSDATLSPWTWLLPGGTVLLLALVVSGVRPRLAEYR